MFVKTSLLKMYENMLYNMFFNDHFHGSSMNSMFKNVLQNMFFMCTFLFIGTIII